MILLLLLEYFGTWQFTKGNWQACLQTRTYVTEFLAGYFFFFLSDTIRSGNLEFN